MFHVEQTARISGELENWFENGPIYRSKRAIRSEFRRFLGDLILAINLLVSLLFLVVCKKFYRAYLYAPQFHRNCETVGSVAATQ